MCGKQYKAWSTAAIVLNTRTHTQIIIKVRAMIIIPLTGVGGDGIHCGMLTVPDLRVNA